MSHAGMGAMHARRRPLRPPSPHATTCTHALWLRYEVARLLVAKVYLIAQHVDVKQLPHVFALVVSCMHARMTLSLTEARITLPVVSSAFRVPTIEIFVVTEFFSDLCQLLVHPLLLLLLVLARPYLLNEVL